MLTETLSLGVTPPSKARGEKIQDKPDPNQARPRNIRQTRAYKDDKSRTRTTDAPHCGYEALGTAPNKNKNNKERRK